MTRLPRIVQRSGTSPKTAKPRITAQTTSEYAKGCTAEAGA
jgi:hypothetical protein